MDIAVPRNRPLVDLFSQATSPDLEVLADLITDCGRGRVVLDSGVKAIILKRKEDDALQSIPDVLEAEIRAFGGNSVVNLFRSGGVTYLELATDVANKLDGKSGKDDDVFAIEEIVIKQAIDKYAPEYLTAQQKEGASLFGVLGQIVQSLAVASGSAVGIAAAGGAAGIASAAGSRVAVLAAPPLAIGAAGYTLFQASGPAFRITVPAVIQIAKIRRRQIDADFAIYTGSLRACL